MIKITKCKKCGSDNVYKNGFCYEHYCEYAREYRRKNQDKFRQYEKTKIAKLKPKKCRECGEEYKSKHNLQMFCSHKCQSDNWIRTGKRVGKNNPGFRNGCYVNRPIKKDQTTNTHLNACRRYRVAFRKENDYDYCELCGWSGALRYETHHIIFASEAPKHPELHNFKNLIYLCIKCHNELHKHKTLRNEIVEKRELSKLFGKNLKVYEKKSIN